MTAKWNACPEFEGVPTVGVIDLCRQMKPDPVPPISANPTDPVNPKDISPAALNDILLSFITRAQVLKSGSSDVLSVWYRNGAKSEAVAVSGTTAYTYENNDFTDGGHLVPDGTNFFFSCEGGARMCKIADLTTAATVTARSTALTDSRILADYVRFPNTSGQPVGIHDDGELVYFKSDLSAHYVVPLYDIQDRVFCETLIDGTRQVRFAHLSEKHPTTDILALIGVSVKSAGNETVNEVYLLEPSSANTASTAVCGLSGAYIERYTLPRGGTALNRTGPALDVLRLTDVEFADKKPTP